MSKESEEKMTKKTQRTVKKIMKSPFNLMSWVASKAMKLQQISFKAKNYIEFDLFKE